MLMEAVLTVAESKRVIAKGVAAHPLVCAALDKGTIIIACGSTNSYVAQELLGAPMEKSAFVIGCTLPCGHPGLRHRPAPLGEIVIRGGKAVPRVTLAQALADLKAGDVFIKGANALDYDKRRVGILFGGAGGTIGAALPAITARKAHLVTPVGLEKLTASDLKAVSELLAGEAARSDWRRGLWVMDTATIITEIEALQLTADVSCYHLASGGIGGAEGAVRLLVSGDQAAIASARRVLDAVAGEPPFPI